MLKIFCHILASHEVFTFWDNRSFLPKIFQFPDGLSARSIHELLKSSPSHYKPGCPKGVPIIYRDTDLGGMHTWTHDFFRPVLRRDHDLKSRIELSQSFAISMIF